MQSFKEFVAEREETPAHGETVHGIHYSHTAGLTQLDGARSGTGIKGAEHKRLGETKDARIKKRVYFYNKHEGEKLPATHEQGLGSHAHSATLHKIYNPKNASDEEYSAVKKTQEKHVYNGEEHGNAFERAVVDHGYHGYTNQGMTVVLNHDHVPVKYEGHRSDLLKAG
jgi:hypothetical protein